MKFSRSLSRPLIYILHTGNLYGTERMALATLEGMTDHEPRVVFAPLATATGSVTAAARQAGYPVVNFANRRQMFAGLVPWFLRFRQIDVIATGIKTTQLCYLMSWLFGVRLRQLHVSHGGTPDSYNGKQRLNAIPVGQVAVSNFVKTRLLEQGVRPDRIVVIDNFLSPTQRLEQRRRPSYLAIEGGRPVDPDRIRVIVVSRIDWIKKTHLVIEAVERFGLGHFQFDFYGTGERLEELRARSAPLPNVRFHGYASDVHVRMQAADLLLHLCPEEPFGLVILEAFSSGLVAVVPDAGGAGDLVEDGKNGLRFRADDSADLAKVLEALRSASATRLADMATDAQRRMDDDYSAARGARRYQSALALFREPGLSTER